MDPRILHSAIVAIVFFVVSHPMTYALVQSVVGNLFTVAIKGCPTVYGLLLHALVFLAVVFLLLQWNVISEYFVESHYHIIEGSIKTGDAIVTAQPVVTSPPVVTAPTVQPPTPVVTAPTVQPPTPVVTAPTMKA